MNMMRSRSRVIFFFLILIMTALRLEGARAEMTQTTVGLPKTIGLWTRPESVKIIDSNNIFKYMNGAGELYLAYRFKHIEIYEYSSEQQDNILVEVYVMETSDDAFGLLSLDWGGEPVTLKASPELPSTPAIAPPARAFYGGGLLRLSTDRLYGRVMAYRETPESRKAVLSLGQSIAANRKSSAEPELLKVLPHSFGLTLKLRRNRIGYFRSHLVLNSLYYLSHQNILDLDHLTEAVTAPYEASEGNKILKRIQFLFVKYPSTGQARQALTHFHSTYLPEHLKGFTATTAAEHTDYFQIEDGWLGYTLNKTCLAIVFECADRLSAQMIMKNLSFDRILKEVNDGE